MGHQADRDVNLAAIGVQAGAVAVDGPPGAKLLVDHLPVGVALQRWEELPEAATGDLPLGIAEELLGAGVPGLDRAVRRRPDDGVAGRGDDRRELLGLLPRAA